MLPAQRNKVDIASLSEEEQKLFRLYGKLPNRKDVLGNKLKERKYFDSGDYALSKAGKQPQQAVGTAIPNPETIPHASTVSSPPGVPAPVGSPNGTFLHHHAGSPTGSAHNGFGNGGGVGSGHQNGSAAGNSFSSPISVPTGGPPSGGIGNGLGNRPPTVSSFPTATGTAGSPSGKESSSLGREEVTADDTMEE